MKNVLRLFGFVLFVALMTSCAQPMPPASQGPPAYTYAERAISFRLRADSQLNLYQGAPHSLLLCVYQLRDPNGFNQLREDYAGLSKLLECHVFDPSVVGTRRIFVQPGQESTVDVDRAEGARYVGIVAGYYLLGKDTSVRLMPIPVGQAGGGSGGGMGRVGKLNVDIHLGSQEILDARSIP